jgi:hypothetical protein
VILKRTTENLVICWQEYKMMQKLWKTVWWGLKKIKKNYHVSKPGMVAQAYNFNYFGVGVSEDNNVRPGRVKS